MITRGSFGSLLLNFTFSVALTVTLRSVSVKLSSAGGSSLVCCSGLCVTAHVTPRSVRHARESRERIACRRHIPPPLPLLLTFSPSVCLCRWWVHVVTFSDLHTVDDGVLGHLPDELGKTDWDVLVAHFLGVDHVGHTFGPASQAMADKLDQMNTALRFSK